MLLWYKGAYDPEATILTDTAKYDEEESELVRRLWQDLGSPAGAGAP